LKTKMKKTPTKLQRKQKDLKKLGGIGRYGAEERKLIYYDSVSEVLFPERDKSLVIEWLDSVLSQSGARPIEFVAANGVQYQKNNKNDCGVYVCMFLKELAQGSIYLPKANEQWTDENWRLKQVKDIRGQLFD